LKRIYYFLRLATLSVVLFACHKDILVEKIPNSEIPDLFFRDFLLLHFDTDMDGFISKAEAKAVKEIDLSNVKGISSVAGIEHFTSIEKLIVKFTAIENLDLKSHSMLERLDCSVNSGLKTLVLPESKRMKSLNCSDTRIVSINLTDFKFLEDFTFNQTVNIGHAIDDLMIKNSSVKSVFCNINIKHLNMSNLPDLEYLSITGDESFHWSYTVDQTVDLTKSAKLKSLKCEYIRCDINVNQSTALEELFLVHVNNKTLDLSKNTSLKTLVMTSFESIDLDISTNKVLETLHLKNNGTVASFKNNTALKTVSWTGPKEGETLDFSNCTLLEKLIIQGFVDVKIDNCIKLIDLTLTSCTFNTFQFQQQFNVLKNVTLLGCNNLTSFTLTGAQSLDSLRIASETKTLDVDISNCINLRSLIFDVENLNKLNASNCSKLTSFKYQHLYDDNRYYLNLSSLNLSHCTSLKSVSVNQNKLTDLDVSGCTALTELSCRNNQLTNMNISGCNALQTLSCQFNQLTNLNINGCDALQTLSCHNNKLKKINVNGCLSLKSLDCSENNLEELNVNGCVGLTSLHCYDNKLENLNLVNCGSLIDLYCTINKINDLNVSDCISLKYLTCYANDLKELDLYSCLALKELRCMDNKDLKTLTINKNHQITILYKDEHTEIVLKE